MHSLQAIGDVGRHTGILGHRDLVVLDRAGTRNGQRLTERDPGPQTCNAPQHLAPPIDSVRAGVRQRHPDINVVTEVESIEPGGCHTADAGVLAVDSNALPLDLRPRLKR